MNNKSFLTPEANYKQSIKGLMAEIRLLCEESNKVHRVMHGSDL